MNNITMPEVRELLKSVETIAVRPRQATQKDLMLAPALFQKLMNDRTNGAIQIQVLIDGKTVEFEVEK